MIKDNYIVFNVAGTTYALPSHEVSHVELVENVTRVPNAPRWVDGVVFSRGVVVPALNLRARFGFDAAPYDSRTRLIVVERESRHVGLIVDSAREFVRIADEIVQPPGEGLTALSGQYLRGVATMGDRMIFILDLGELLENATVPAGDDPAVPRSFQET
jgi:chemotaxis signal transduction protein